MHKVHPKKILNSKWTAANPKNKEKHFVITKVDQDEDGNIIECLIEAVMTNNCYPIQWRDLNDSEQWTSGWN